MYEQAKIVTIVDETNFGNRLQNYALTQLLYTYSNKVSTVQYIEPTNGIVHKISGTIRVLGRAFLNNLTKVKTGELRLIKQREKSFRHFSEKYISILPEMYTDTVSSSDIVYVLGSDQIWNYNWFSRFLLSAQLGSYAPCNARILSYAASFGISTIEDEDAISLFRSYLPRLHAISVREHRGVELVRSITGLNAAVVLDPTLMLTGDEWLEITEHFVNKNEKYVLTYFLGRPSDKQERDIQSYAKMHECRIRRIFDIRDKESYVAGPQDFVELFSNAEYVFTDSYHACCFSILFHKQFTVFNRAGTEGKTNMNSRMETLFRLFGLDSVVMDEGMAPQIDYVKVDKLLAQHRVESRAWLDKAMEK